MKERINYFTIEEMDLYLDQTLIELDEKILFTCINESKQRYLVAVANDSKMYGYFVVVPVSNQKLIDMMFEKILVHDVFSQNENIFLVDKRNREDVKVEVLPKSMHSILPEEEKYLRLKSADVLNLVKEFSKVYEELPCPDVKDVFRRETDETYFIFEHTKDLTSYRFPIKTDKIFLGVHEIADNVNKYTKLIISSLNPDLSITKKPVAFVCSVILHGRRKSRNQNLYILI